MKRLKLLIIGHGRHGKDTVSEILESTHSYTFASTRDFTSLFMYNQLKESHGYKSEEECYNDRSNCRVDWYNAICKYNATDPARLGKEIFNNYDIYCGLRDKREYDGQRSAGIFDYAIWVDRSHHLTAEPYTSMNLTENMADFSIDNNGTIADLIYNTNQLITHLEIRN